MKKIIVTARKEDFERMGEVLKNKLFFHEENDDLVRVIIFIPDKELDELINKLLNIVDFRYKESMIEVFTPEFIISSVLKRAEKRIEKVREKTPVEKLIDSTKPYLKLSISKIALTSIAGIIALTGLFMNNVAIIIGAMLLSPLLGPIYAFAINTAVGKAKDAFRSIANLVALLLLVILFSYLTTLLISQFMGLSLSLTSEILARMSASFIYILMALLLGFASILALSEGISESIAGVAIAAALLPPVVVTGISLAIYPSKAVDSLILTLENVLGLMAGSLSAMLLLDIGPRKYYEKVVARKFIVRTYLVLIALLVLLFVFSLLMYK